MIKRAVPETFLKKLKMEGRDLEFPQDRELELKVKYDIDDDGGSFTLKISWDNDEFDEDNEED
jgi:hypothetical protein